MKKNQSIIIFVIILLSACTQKSDFIIDKNGIIIEYKGQNTIVIIPEKIGNIEVVAIDTLAFTSGIKISSLFLPDSIKIIGQETFQNHKLTSLIIPDRVIDIGRGTFANNNLSSIILSSNIKNIGEGAFENNQLTTIVIPNSVTTIDNYAFNNKLTEITIGSNVNISSTYRPVSAGSVPWGVINEDNSITYDNPDYDPTIDNYVLFSEFYKSNEKKAGTYIFENDEWKLK